jgi:hypothetical protein
MKIAILLTLSYVFSDIHDPIKMKLNSFTYPLYFLIAALNVATMFFWEAMVQFDDWQNMR